MNAVLTIARSSVTEHVRRKLVIFFLGLAVLAGVGLIVIRLQQDAGVTLADVLVTLIVNLLPPLTVLAALAVSMNNIGRPFGDGEAMLILARPVARWQYALGRLVASWALLMGLCLVILALLQGMNALVGTGLGAELWAYWATQAFNLLLLAAITTLMSALLANPVLAAIVALVLYATSTIIPPIYQFVSQGEAGGVGRAIITVLYYITPKRMTEQATMIAWPLAYLAVTVLLTMVVVQRKEL